MGANAQTTVPTFTAGDVLTAAQQNQSARTGVPVFATTTTRNDAFGGTGEKTLAEGQLCYVEGTGLQSYNGTSWVTWGTAPSAGALVRVGGGTMTASASTTVSSVFSSTYHAYRIILSNLTADASGRTVTVQLDGITSGYRWNAIRYQGLTATASASFDGNVSTATSWRAGQIDTVATGAVIDILNPNLASGKLFVSHNQLQGGNYELTTTFGLQSSTTQATGVVIASNGTLTGTINVYGYALS